MSCSPRTHTWKTVLQREGLRETAMTMVSGKTCLGAQNGCLTIIAATAHIPKHLHPSHLPVVSLLKRKPHKDIVVKPGGRAADRASVPNIIHTFTNYIDRAEEPRSKVICGLRRVLSASRLLQICTSTSGFHFFFEHSFVNPPLGSLAECRR